jgi:branched-chain amino acid transport system substrate-binding protein
VERLTNRRNEKKCHWRNQIVAVIGLSFCFSPLAFGSRKNAEKNMPISIALVFNLSQQAEAVQQVVEGIELASSDLEKSGLKIKLLKYDSKDSPGGTLKATQQALAEKPDALIAELDSSKAFVAANEAEAAKTVMITPLATSYNITEGKRFVFRGTFSDTQQGDALAKFAIKNGSKTVAIVSDVGQLYSQTLAKRFASAFLTNGGKVILAEEINPDDQAFEKAFQKISAMSYFARFILKPLLVSYIFRVKKDY